MKKIIIIGDSFGADSGEHSWVDMLSQKYSVANLSQRGISQYRLYCNLMSNLPDVQASDAVIIFHTNPDRVYLPDSVDFPTRSLESHPYCDLVASDSLEKSQWAAIAKTYYKYFYDREQQDLWHRFLVKHIMELLESCVTIHCSGFDLPLNIKSFGDVVRQHPGPTNHCSEAGNRAIYNFIESQLQQHGI